MHLQLINIRGIASLSAQVEEVIREVCFGRCVLEKRRSVLQHLIGVTLQDPDPKL